MTPDDTLPCTHPAACLSDGACGWCEAIAQRDALAADLRWCLAPEEGGRRVQQTARWAIEGARRWRALIEERDAARADAHRDHEREVEMGETLARVVGERAALAAHVERLTEALEPIGAFAAVSGTDTSLSDAVAVAFHSSTIPGMERAITLGDLRRAVAALASTPAASLEEHDRRVRAEALREAAKIVSSLHLAGTLGEIGAYPRAAGVLHLRADAVERGEL